MQIESLWDILEGLGMKVMLATMKYCLPSSAAAAAAAAAAAPAC